MSDHIPDAGKMVSDRVVMLRTIAAILDHPNVYMGGPSQRNMRRAEDILTAIAERCAQMAEEHEKVAEPDGELWIVKRIAAAIRALYRGEAGR